MTFTTELLEIKTLEQLEVFKQKVVKETEIKNNKFRCAEYKEKLKVKIECECGCIIRKGNKTHHYKSKKHKKLIEQKKIEKSKNS